MSEPKTKPTSQSVMEFLNTVELDGKRRDSFEILAMMEKITGEKAVMWGSSIVGFVIFYKVKILYTVSLYYNLLFFHYGSIQ